MISNEQSYDFEIDRIVKEIKKSHAKTIGLQFPEGLKTHAAFIALEIENKTGAQTVIFVDPVYGACDTKKMEAALLKLDMVIHFGHTNLVPDFSKNKK